ncbi:MAG: DUF2793 domain-containing protein [Hyphomicrobiaceae bacterium]
MTVSPNLKLPYIAAAQAQKHVTHNEALRTLDALVQLVVIARGLTAPPATPLEGDRYLIGPGATGSWQGHDGKIAAWQDGAWAMLAPLEGWTAWVVSEGKLVVLSAGVWVDVALGGSGPTADFNPVSGGLLGVNATADTTNRLAVSSPASLFNNAGAGHQLKVNKAASSDTASFLFQTGFSGRAEIGTTGDDTFSFKVSSNGTVWDTPLRLQSKAAICGGAPATIADQLRFVVSNRTTVVQPGDSRTLAQFATGDGVSSRVLLDGYGAHCMLSFRRAEGTAASPQPVAANAEIGGITAWGYGATGYNGGPNSGRANIILIASETWTDSAQSAAVSIETTTNGTAVPVERLRILHDGRVAIGSSEVYDVQAGIMQSGLQVNGLGSEASFSVVRWAAGGAQPNIHFAKSRGTTVGTRGIVSKGDGMGGFTWTGDDGAQFMPAAAVRGQVDGTPTTGNVPGRILFLTAVDGGGSAVVERMRVESGGTVRPGADNAQALGSATHRWSQVWAANGTIQTSDAREKVVESQFDPATALALVEAIDPVLFRWRTGGQVIVPSRTETETTDDGVEVPRMEAVPVPGRRLHAGFIAQDVKSAMDAAGVEFAAWGLDDASDPESRQWLRSDELVPVLWSAVRQLKAELAALKEE